MDPFTILLLLGMVGGVLAIAAPFILITMGAAIYVWTHLYPWLKSVGKFGAKPANFFTLALVVFLLLVGILMVLIFLSPARMPGLWVLLPIVFIVGMFVLLLVALFPMELAVVVWIIRAIKWVYAHLRGWVEGMYFAARLQMIKFKIKTDTWKEMGGKGKLGALKGEFSGDVRRVQRRVPTRVARKKEKGFMEKLAALKGEFSDDVERARGKFFKRR